MEAIGMVGMGRMGSAMAARLAAEGRLVTGWTRSGLSPARADTLGIAAAETLAVLVERSDIIVTSLYDDAAVTAMLDTLLEFDLTGRLILETSTATPANVTARADAIAAAGAAICDAPISGGPEMVSAGQCGIFIGGAADAAKRAEAALTPLSDRVFHVGPLGTGMVMKCINNSMLQTYVAALAEQLAIAKRAGLPLETALRILSGGPAGVPMVRDRIDKVLGTDKTVGFTVQGAHKDNLVFQTVAAEHEVDAATLRLAETLFAHAMANGLAQDDPAAVLARAFADA